MKPRSWATVLIPELHPNMWSSLPGFAEAATRGFRESPQPVRASTPRVRRSLADLTEERDALVQKRDRLSPDMGPLDHGMLSGIRRKPNGADRKRDATTDRGLTRYAEITKRIEYLEYRMRNERRRHGPHQIDQA